jgi:A118 family predicted phage portal protein
MFDKLINWLKGGMRKVQLATNPLSLASITDHPLIQIDQQEYQRINSNLYFYRGQYDDIERTTIEGKRLKRPYNSLNLLETASNRFASILYNENCTITIDNEEAQAYIDEVLDNNRFNTNMQRYLSSMLALGGIAVRPYWDASAQQIKLSWIQAPNFYPLRNNTGDISECAISSKTVINRGNTPVYYTLLEFHQWLQPGYTITNQLFRSDSKNQVGKQVPLNELYEDLPESVVYPGLTQPLFTYIKPAKFNNIDVNSPLGIGFADNSRSIIRELNEAFDQFGTELKLGKRRIAVTGNMAQWLPDENGKAPAKPYFDPDDEVYVAVDARDKFSVQDLSAPLRTPQYQVGLATLIKMFEMQNGLSIGTFSLAPDGDLKTATQVVSENSATYQTRNSYLTNVEYGIKQLVIAILELSKGVITNTGKSLYTGELVTKDDIAVSFDDGVFVDKSQQADLWVKLYAAGLSTKAQAIEKVQGVTTEEAEKIAQQITAETPTPAMPKFETDQNDEGGE